MKAPNFTLQDQDGQTHTLSDYAGQWLLVYFYPKDDTPGCTKEACNFRDGITKFKEKGVAIVGISKDTVDSHKKFVAKYHLNFPLLSDESREIIKAYGAWTERGFMGHPGILRNSYLINPEGEIVKEYKKVKPEQHADDILADLEAL